MTPSAAIVRGGRQATWPREKLIEALLRYAELYGADFTAAAFSPSAAKWQDKPELIERYYDGDPDGIGAWPSLNAIKSHFGGSFDAAREAAGFEANKPGPAKRRAAGEARPIRNVSHAKATRIVYVPKVGDEARIRSLEGRLERALARADRLASELERSRARKARTVERTKTKTKVITKTKRVTDDAAVVRARERAEAKVARAEAKLADARAAAEELKRKVSEARSSATRAAAKLERAEATISELRGERRELRDEVAEARDAEAAAKTMLSGAQEAVERLRGETRVIVKDAPEQAQIDAARTEVLEARGLQRDAEVRAARAEREYMALAVAARGEERKLTKAEIDELRSSGPTGPALLAAALKDLAQARSLGGKQPMKTALRKVASAAVSWMDRL